MQSSPSSPDGASAGGRDTEPCVTVSGSGETEPCGLTPLPHLLVLNALPVCIGAPGLVSLLLVSHFRSSPVVLLR